MGREKGGKDKAKTWLLFRRVGRKEAQKTQKPDRLISIF